jgi:hypothetical protein
VTCPCPFKSCWRRQRQNTFLFTIADLYHSDLELGKEPLGISPQRHQLEASSLTVDSIGSGV